jgi:hypothetical protein
MDNPNEYDDERYTSGSNDLIEAVGTLWEAGASEDEIRREFEQALESAKE